MYLDFFQINEAPFNSTLDPKFFYTSPQHEEALASLVYAVQERKGLVVLTGCIGAGKTLVGRLVCERLAPAAITAQFSNSTLDSTGLLDSICSEFQITVPSAASLKQRLMYLREFLITAKSKDQVAILVLDDAHTLSDENLEELLHVSDLEASQAKLLQIVMLGQPALGRVLHRESARPFLQRVFRTFHISPLTREITEAYIQHRLRTAGAARTDIFSADALDLIQTHAAGVPRVINNLCDNLLLSAFAGEQQVVDGDRVRTVSAEIGLATRPPENAPPEPPQTIYPAARGAEVVRGDHYAAAQLGRCEAIMAAVEIQLGEVQRTSTKLASQEVRMRDLDITLDHKISELLKIKSECQTRGLSLERLGHDMTKQFELHRSLSEEWRRQADCANTNTTKLEHIHSDAGRLLSIIEEREGQVGAKIDHALGKLEQEKAALLGQVENHKKALHEHGDDICNTVSQLEFKESAWSQRLRAVEQRINDLADVQRDLSAAEAKMMANAAMVKSDLAAMRDDICSQTTQKRSEFTTLVKDTECRVADHKADLLAMSKEAQNLLTDLQKSQMDGVKRIADAQEQVQERLQDQAGTIQEQTQSSKKELDTLVHKAETLLHEPQELLNQISEQLSRAEVMMQTIEATEQSAASAHGAAVHEMQQAREELNHIRQETIHVERRVHKAGSEWSDVETRWDDKLAQVANLKQSLVDLLKQSESAPQEILDNIRGQIASLAEQLQDELHHSQNDILRGTRERFDAQSSDLEKQLNRQAKEHNLLVERMNQRGQESFEELSHQVAAAAQAKDKFVQQWHEQAEAAAGQLQQAHDQFRKSNEALFAVFEEQGQSLETQMRKHLEKAQRKLVTDLQDRLAEQVKDSVEQSADDHQTILERIRNEGQVIADEFKDQLVQAQHEVFEGGQEKADAISAQVQRAVSETSRAQQEVLEKLSAQAEARASSFQAKLAEAKKTYDTLLQQVPEHINAQTENLAGHMTSAGPFFNDSID